MFQFSADFLIALIKGLYDGDISEYDLPENLYLSIGEFLREGVYEGYGIKLAALAEKINEGIAGKFDQTDLDLLEELRTNVYMFSAAKTFSQVKEMTDALIGEDGKRVGFSDFKKSAMEIFDTYNKNYLKTEYDTAIGQAQSAAKWNGIEKDKEILPYLRYSAVMDDVTSEICAPLDGTVAKVDDPIWDSIAPLNHFNCRCLLEQLEEGEESADREEKAKEVEGEMQDAFKMNPGKDGYVFGPEHPYFDVEKKDKDFAKENFGLDIPEND